jgi:hypothetical protein
MRPITTYVRATFVAFAFFVRRQPVATVLLTALFGYWVWLGVHRLTETPEEARAEAMVDAQIQQERAQQAAIRDAERAQQTAEQATKRKQDRALCRVKSICEEYAHVRQECATAGNFQTCVRVKMGDENFEEVGSCTNDGHIAYLPAEPGAVDCFFSKIQ